MFGKRALNLNINLQPINIHTLILPCGSEAVMNFSTLEEVEGFHFDPVESSLIMDPDDGKLCGWKE